MRRTIIRNLIFFILMIGFNLVFNTLANANVFFKSSKVYNQHKTVNTHSNKELIRCEDGNSDYIYDWADKQISNENPEIEMVKAISDCATSVSASDVCEGGSYTVTHGTSDCCDGNARLRYYNAVDGSWTYGSYGTDQYSYTITGASAGTYTFRTRIYGENGNQYCSSSETVTVHSDPSVSISANRTDVCVGGSVTLTANASGGIGSYSYQWQHNGTGSWSNISGATSSTYDVPTGSTFDRDYRCRVTTSGSGCGYGYSSSINITVHADPTQPTITRDPNTSPVCEGTSLDVTLSSSGSGGCGTTDIEYQYYNGSWSSWSGSAPSFSAVYGVTNYYRARRTATGNGCDDSSYDQVSWSVDEQSDAGTMSVTNSQICEGGSTEFEANGTVGFQQMQYQWDGTGGSWNDWGSDNPHSWSSSNDGHTLYVRSWANNGACGDDYSSPVSVDVIADPSVSISADRTDVCVGGSVTLEVTSTSGGIGSYSYQWQKNESNISGATNSTYSVPTSSTHSDDYRCRVTTGGSGCGYGYSSAINITVHADPTAPSITRDPDESPVCEGATLDISSSGGSGGCGTVQNEYRYNEGTWSSWNTSTPSFTATEGTNYYESRRTATGNGCETSSSNQVSWTVEPDPAAPTATKSPDVSMVCEGQTLTLTGVTDNGGGTGSCDIEYRYSTDGGSSYSSWSTSNPGFSATGSDNRIQIRKTCSGSGCDNSSINTYSWDVEPDPAAPTATKSPDVSTVCEGQTLTLTGVTDNGGGTGSCDIEYRYSTDGGSSYSSWSTSNPGFSATGSDNRIQIRKTCSGSGCDNSSINTYSWDVEPDPSVSISAGNTDVCVGGDVTLTANASGGIGSYSYQWQYNDGSWHDVGSGSDTYNVPTSSTLDYDYRCQVTTGGSGCGTDNSNTINIQVHADPVSPSITRDPDESPVCEGATLDISSSGGSGGCGTVQNEYRYNDGTWSSWNTSTPSFTAAEGTNYYESRRTATGNGCETSSSNQVSWDVISNPENGIVQREAPLDANMCIGEDITVSVTGSGGGISCNDEVEYKIEEGGSEQTYSGTFTTTEPGEYYFRTKRTCSGLGCDDPGWSEWELLYHVLDNGNWTGASDENWHNAENWCGSVPGNGDEVVIPATAANMPEIYGSAGYARHVTIEAGATLKINSDQALMVHGSLYSSGSIEMVNENEFIMMKGNDVDLDIIAPLKNLRIMSGNALINLQSDLEVQNELSISEGHFNLNGNDIDLSGNLKIEDGGTMNAENSKITLSGDEAQSIKANNNEFHDVEFNNTSGTDAAIQIVEKDLIIENSATFNNGIVNTGSQSLVFTSAAISNPGNENSFVDGRVVKENFDAVFTFPTGDVSDRDIGSGLQTYKVWAPFTATPAGSTDVSVEYHYSNEGLNEWWYHEWTHAHPLTHTTDREYWLVNSSENMNVSLSWKDNNPCEIHDFCDDGASMLEHLTIAYWDGKWRDAGGDASGEDTENGNITSAYPIPFASKGERQITFGAKDEGVPLPVELVSFDAGCDQDNQNIELTWTTASETNNDYFTLYRSKTGLNFEEIDRVDGHGSTSQSHTYTYADDHSPSGDVYYKLSQTDFDGTRENLNIISINCFTGDNQYGVQVYPNPVSDELNILFDSWPDHTVNICIYDMQGRIVMQKKLKNILYATHIQLPMHNIAPGMYMLWLQSDTVNKKLKIEKH